MKLKRGDKIKLKDGITQIDFNALGLFAYSAKQFPAYFHGKFPVSHFTSLERSKIGGADILFSFDANSVFSEFVIPEAWIEPCNERRGHHLTKIFK